MGAAQRKRQHPFFEGSSCDGEIFFRLCDGKRGHNANDHRERHTDVGDLPGSELSDVKRACPGHEQRQPVAEYIGSRHRRLTLFLNSLDAVRIDCDVLGGRRESHQQPE